MGRETEGAVNLIDTLLANNNIVSPSSNSIDDILGALGDTLPVESRDALKICHGTATGNWRKSCYIIRMIFLIYPEENHLI